MTRGSCLVVVWWALLFEPGNVTAAGVLQGPGPDAVRHVKVGDAVKLRGGPVLTVTVDTESTWQDVPQLAASAKGKLTTLILTFSGETEIVSFYPSNVALTAGSEKQSPIGIAVANESTGAPPKWVLVGGTMHSLGIVFRGHSLQQDGIVYQDKTGRARFLGHTGAPLYLVYAAPSGPTIQNVTAQLDLEVAKEQEALAVQLK
jgi:hypothetical protein